VLALVGKALRDGDAALSVGLLVAFEGMLRTGEMFNLICKDCFVADDNSSVIPSLGLTKGGSRRGAAESVVLYDRIVVDFVRARLLQCRPGDKLISMSPVSF
jgi:hypothetical protein